MLLKINSAYLTDVLQELHNQVQDLGLGSTLFKKSTITIPPAFGNGTISTNQFKNGLDVIAINGLELKQNLDVVIEGNMEQAVYELTFCMSGNTSWGFKGTQSDLEKRFSTGAFLVSPSVEETLSIKANSPSSFVTILLKPTFLQDYLLSVVESKEEHEMIELLSNPHNEMHIAIPELNADIQMVLHQIEKNNFQGFLKNIFLESKALELITYFFALTQAEYRQNHPKKLKQREKEAIMEAARILENRIDNPPGIVELSKLTGMNPYKLRTGFKEVFQATVYEYLRKIRMEKARVMLENKEISVSEAGYMVGYTNLSHFAAAFKKEFGINPSQYNSSSIQKK